MQYLPHFGVSSIARSRSRRPLRCGRSSKLCRHDAGLIVLAATRAMRDGAERSARIASYGPCYSSMVGKPRLIVSRYWSSRRLGVFAHGEKRGSWNLEVSAEAAPTAVV